MDSGAVLVKPVVQLGYSISKTFKASIQRGWNVAVVGSQEGLENDGSNSRVRETTLRDEGRGQRSLLLEAP